MIDSDTTYLFKIWVDKEAIFIDNNSGTYMYKGNANIGENEYYLIPAEYTGLISPEEIEEEEIFACCTGKLTTTLTYISKFEPIPVKLSKVNSFKYLDYEHHKDNLLSAIAFAYFHYVENYPEGIPDLSRALKIAKTIDGTFEIYNKNVVKAALLYNIINDTYVDKESIAMLFNNEVSSIIETLTHINKSEVKRPKLLLKKLVKASIEAKQVQLAILLTRFQYISTLDENEREVQLSWIDKMAAVCKVASPKLFHFYLVEREKFS
jgi:hypothetical protein